MVEQRQASTANRIRLVALALCFALLATACLPVAGSQEVAAGDADLRERELQLELDRLALENQRLAQELASDGQQPVPTIPPAVQPTQPPAVQPTQPPAVQPTQPPQPTRVPPTATPVPPTPTPVPPTPTPVPPTPTPTPVPVVTLTRLTIDQVKVISDCDGIEGAGDFRFTVEATITDADGRNVSRRWYSGDTHRQINDGGNHRWSGNIIEIRSEKGVADVALTFTSVEADKDIFGNTWNDERMVGDDSRASGNHRGSLLGFDKSLWNGSSGCQTRLDYSIESLEL